MNDTMLPHPLQAALYRVVRANEHLKDLGERVIALTLEQQKTAIAHFQAYGREQLGRVSTLRVGVPLSFPVRIGEICYNLRTALEYLVFEIAKLNSGSPQDFTNFPLVNTKDKFRSWAKDARSKGINSAHIAAIERFQPYKGCNWATALVNLSNKDKHREFPKLGGTAALAYYTPFGDVDYAALSLPIIRAPHPLTGEEMDMKVDFQSTISFDDGMPVIQTLKEIVFGVTETIDAFEPEFKR